MTDLPIPDQPKEEALKQPKRYSNHGFYLQEMISSRMLISVMFRPEGNPGSNFPFVQGDFDDSSWKNVNLPHDWAIEGPFITGEDAGVGGSMGRLPSPGVAWYRKKLEIPESDAGKSIFLDVDGAMSYSMVWLNGNLVGGWPFGYASWRSILHHMLYREAKTSWLSGLIIHRDLHAGIREEGFTGMYGLPRPTRFTLVIGELL